LSAFPPLPPNSARYFDISLFLTITKAAEGCWCVSVGDSGNDATRIERTRRRTDLLEVKSVQVCTAVRLWQVVSFRPVGKTELLEANDESQNRDGSYCIVHVCGRGRTGYGTGHNKDHPQENTYS